MSRIIEIISYQLKPGTSDAFHQAVKEIAMPLHQNAGIDVLAYGHSLHGEDAYFLIRAFDDLAQIETSLNNFYNSDEWVNGPRSAIIDRIQTSVKSVLPLNEAAISALKSSWG